MKPVLLDLFCGAGGAAMGYHLAGFDVVGVDIEDQKNYPFRFIRSDAVDFLVKHGSDFHAIHASPPCQRYTKAKHLRGNEHPDLIDPVRDAMPDGVPWVIENVPGSPLRNPIMLCGLSFGLGTYRHREFECSFDAYEPDHLLHEKKTTKMGRPPKEGEMMHVVGHFSGVEAARKAMGINWMTQCELKEAIPPAYTKFIGLEMIEKLK